MTAVNDFDLVIDKSELVSLIGPNGAGKTTSFNLISGLDRPDAGVIVFDGRPIGGLGNVSGAIVGAVALVSLPELFRALAEYRMLIYGIALLLLIRFRPQGLMGTL